MEIMLKIAVDFDNTITTEEIYPNIGKPRTRFIKRLIMLQKQGHELILWTCREGKRLEEAIEWCREQGLVFNYINEHTKEMLEKFKNNPRKVSADIYIDDKNMSIEEFMNTENYLTKKEHKQEMEKLSDEFADLVMAYEKVKDNDKVERERISKAIDEKLSEIKILKIQMERD